MYVVQFEMDVNKEVSLTVFNKRMSFLILYTISLPFVMCVKKTQQPCIAELMMPSYVLIVMRNNIDEPVN
jgi:hypothetical protein